MFRKLCDYHRTEIGGDGAPYLQIHGTISEQVEYPNSEDVDYRFLTPYQNSKLAFCNPTCFEAWIEEQGRKHPFVRRKLIPRRTLD